eukprot:6209700-Pleurochrysis_carterae.AAC.5
MLIRMHLLADITDNRSHKTTAGSSISSQRSRRVRLLLRVCAAIFSAPCSACAPQPQILADYASLLTGLKLQLNATNCPVVSFGGSYGGTLTTLLRLKCTRRLERWSASSGERISRACPSPHFPATSARRTHFALLQGTHTFECLATAVRQR